MASTPAFSPPPIPYFSTPPIPYFPPAQTPNYDPPLPTRYYLAITTPFVQPSECSFRSYGTFSRQSSGLDGVQATIYEKAIFVDAGNPIYGGCVPTAWDGVPKQDVKDGAVIYFSPAVCPSSWVTVDYSAVVSVQQAVTGAVCCQRDYNTATGGVASDPSVSLYCTSAFGPDPSITHTGEIIVGPGNTQTTLLTIGIFAHLAWSVGWEASDISLLTPAPTDFVPVITTYYTPDPGQGTSSSSTTTSTTRTSTSTNTYRYTYSPLPTSSSSASADIRPFLIIGLPIIIFCPVFIATCYACCSKNNDRSKFLAGAPTRDVELRQSTSASQPDDQHPEPAPVYEPPTSDEAAATGDPPPPYRQDMESV